MTSVTIVLSQVQFFTKWFFFASDPRLLLQALVSEIKSLIRRSNTNITTQNKLKIRQKARDGNVCKHRQIFVVSLDLKEQTTISLDLQATVANSVSEYKTFPGYIAGKWARVILSLHLISSLFSRSALQNYINTASPRQAVTVTVKKN